MALCLDLMLREGTHDKHSLDDAMRLLWRDYGARDIGVPEDGVEQAAYAIGGAAMKQRLAAFFRDAVHGTRELPLVELLARAGFKLTVEPGTAPALGARTTSAPDGVRLTQVLDGGGAQAAGLSAGDLIIAIDGIKTSQDALEKRLTRTTRGATVHIHAFRRDELITRSVRLGRAELNVKLERAAAR